MSESREFQERLRQMRDKADELDKAAERADDPGERKRLHDKAERLKSQSDEESMERAGDIYPTE